ncbi:MAG: AAA family ATPase, partial [Bacteroidaceae bacterium]|nr:AAA family ATPase [Bacteroidaceae bacterium]
MGEVKAQLQAIVDTYSFVRSRSETRDIRLGANMIITGESGTGKTMLATIICDYFHQNKIISANRVSIVDAVDYERFVENWDENIRRSRGGLLFFDNAQKLLPNTYSHNVNPLDKLFVEMSQWNEDPIVIIAGLPQGLEDFFEKNPSARNRFKYRIKLSSYDFDEMSSICRMMLKTQYGLDNVTPAAQKKMLHLFKYKLKQHDKSFSNGHLAYTTAEDIFTSFISRGISNDNLEVTEDDVRGYIPPVLTAEEILHQMDEFVGADLVKTAVREIANEVQASMERKSRGLSNEQMAMHIVLTGNPGTGKTTIARKLGEILEAVGYLDSGHVVEVDRSQIVSPYQGETPKLVDALCDKAKGGILFIDEAYTLAPLREDGSKDEQGAQALEKLMKRMEDDRGQFVVIAAGYQNEMENLFRINPGIKSRFNRFLHIDDYNEDELYLILERFVQKSNFQMDEGCKLRVKAAIQEMYDNRAKNFSNGRAMRELFEVMKRRQAERVHMMDVTKATNEELLTFTASDVPYEDHKKLEYQDVLKKFDNLIGLESVRQEISSLVTMLNMQIERGDRSGIQGLHYVFTGNPGTGKTTVARIMAEVLHALGVVPRGHLVEADRSKLVAGFTGQTAIKTNQLVDSAIGGVLFIDEAYMLVTSDMDNFGKEAVDTLLKRLEDDRGKFVCIVAGYTEEMHHFMNSNPGLSSRFTQTINFPDYSASELCDIFYTFARLRNFVIEDSQRSKINQFFERMYAMRT